ncbi:sensor domain-containing diguanylate cyclase [Robertmurraya korlensis]|uniref:sensor domain-containing diguanylate cyclase n=1 Tax=Robertmurraya korlensis TaxID=519977 RepID=UPI002040C386|nr:sensor domain-containing diguanylate cyclase [Robertmurraya korlensis]MCM3601679.1 sensor domain-containing diguanylate cyclase [Robertmurraya korlensis]
MVSAINEFQLYKNFNELALDILELAREVMPDRLFFLSTLTNEQQTILKLSEKNHNIQIKEGMSIPVKQSVCHRIDFQKAIPLVIEDISKETDLDDIRRALLDANINSYLGVPIKLKNGETFGTLCAVHEEAKEFNWKNVRMIERLAKMFSYYLELEHLAFRDQLTGIYNRQFLYKYFNLYSTKGGALFFLDLDGFKKINDMLGHDTGDLVLKEVALRIEEILKQQKIDGFAARLGGDEFIINITGEVNYKDLREKAECFLSRLSTWDIHLKEFNLSASMGIVFYPPSFENNISVLLKDADNALYRAKANGKNSYQFF